MLLLLSHSILFMDFLLKLIFYFRLREIFHGTMKYLLLSIYMNLIYLVMLSLCKKASNHHANLPLEMYSFTL